MKSKILRLATRKKYWKYLWLGPALVLMGLSAGVVCLEPVPLGLLISGIVPSGLWLLFQARESSGGGVVLRKH